MISPFRKGGEKSTMNIYQVVASFPKPILK
jgi:hypothetical protein